MEALHQLEHFQRKPHLLERTICIFLTETRSESRISIALRGYAATKPCSKRYLSISRTRRIGIGKEVALQLAAAGARVVIVARNRTRAEAVIAHYPEQMVFLHTDLSCPDEQERLVNEIKQRFPELAILVNNAGIQVNMPAVAMGHAGLMTAFRGEISVNLMALIALSFGLMPLLATQDEAVIVNVSSGLAVAPKRTAPVYCASKAGLQTLSRTLRYRCEDAAPTIRVVDVVMALVDTAVTRERGGQKISGQAAARAIVKGIEQKRDEVWVGKTRLPRIINRLSPALAHKLLRNA